MKFTRRKGTLRLVDATGTPWYLELKFDEGDFSGPMGVPKTEEEMVMHRGVVSADMHYSEGGDDKVMAPLNLTFSAMIEDTTISTYLLAWLEGGTVNAKTTVTTKGTTTRKTVTNPAFADSSKKCFNVEIKWDGSADLVYHYNEVWFDLSEQKLAESDEKLALSLSGQIYGTIVRDTAFTTGTDVTA